MLFHALQQRCLGARRHAVDLIHQQQIGEDRPLVEAEILGIGGCAEAKDGGAQNVGRHQVGGSLHALEAQAEQPAQSLDDQRLGNARHAFQQRMALAENGDQHLFDHPCLAGDYPPQLRAGVGDELVGCAELADSLDRLRRDLRGQTLAGGRAWLLIRLLICVLIRFVIRFVAHEALSCCLD